MNPSIYEFNLLPLEYGKEISTACEIPYKIIKPLGVYNNKLSLLVDIDTINNDEETIHIIRARAFHDFKNFCDDPSIISKYTYLNSYDNIHYFVWVEKLDLFV